MGEQPIDVLSERDELALELDALRRRLGELADELALQRVHAESGQARARFLEDACARTLQVTADRAPDAGDSGFSQTLSEEPTRELVRAILRPDVLLSALGWHGDEREIALPIPADPRGVIDPAASASLLVVADGDPLPLRRTLCSIVDRAAQPLAVTIVVPGPASRGLQELLRRIAVAIPAIRVAHAADVRPGPAAQRLSAGEELIWGWPGAPGASDPVKLAYLVPGLAPEGSGGIHSVVQEAGGLRELGVEARVCVPSSALARAQRLYGDSLFVDYASDSAIADAVGDATVAVATEHTSVSLLRRLSRDRPELALAYYVQDYEPLFADLGSARSDQALLSYTALPSARLFAKTHFIRNVVGALHRTPVAKVEPSLDRSVFNAEGRPANDARSLAVTAMVRPRTPRRRPRATLAALAKVHASLGDGVTIATFGCEAEELAACGPQHPFLNHLGRLSREQVAEQLKRTDVFIDASAYQAFGRTGLEAMACGAVPVLPSLGGVREYAEHAENAIVLDDDSPAALADAVLELAGDRARLRKLREAGTASAAQFSIERAARSQLELFRALAAGRTGSSGE